MRNVTYQGEWPRSLPESCVIRRTIGWIAHTKAASFLIPPDESLSQITQSNYLAPGGSEWVVILRETCRGIFLLIGHLDLEREFCGISK